VRRLTRFTSPTARKDGDVTQVPEALFEDEPRSQPAGLVVRRDLISTEDESDLMGRLLELDLHPVVMHGQPSRRLVRHFGLRYVYASLEIAPGEQPPAWLDKVRECCAGLAGVTSDELAQILVTSIRREPELAGTATPRRSGQ
jgi:hypothetical protein